MKVREELDENNYFEPSKVEFVPTGCTLLDCALGGGWALGRIANLVGDRSTAKTALATEAVINFLNKYPDGAAYYRETEAAFDMNYAESMGMPINKVHFGNEDEPILTIEGFAREIEEVINKQIKSEQPAIYVLDSLDALSDEDEMKRDIGEGTYGMAKAKTLSILFRKIVRKLERANVLLLVVSQVRENIGVTFGEKYKRSGGKSLDFYASQITWLAHIKTLDKQINRVTRPYGVIIKAKIKKNKVGPAFREVQFPFIFNYGVDDLQANVDWLKSIGSPCEEGLIAKLSEEEYLPTQQRIKEQITNKWNEIESKFAPKRKKY